MSKSWNPRQSYLDPDRRRYSDDDDDDIHHDRPHPWRRHPRRRNLFGHIARQRYPYGRGFFGRQMDGYDSDDYDHHDSFYGRTGRFGRPRDWCGSCDIGPIKCPTCPTCPSCPTCPPCEPCGDLCGTYAPRRERHPIVYYRQPTKTSSKPTPYVPERRSHCLKY